MPMFKVRGWKRDRSPQYCAVHDDGDESFPCECTWTRTAMSPVVEIAATDGVQAAFRFALLEGIHTSQWWNVGPKPFVVIRVSNMEDQNP